MQTLRSGRPHQRLFHEALAGPHQSHPELGSHFLEPGPGQTDFLVSNLWFNANHNANRTKGYYAVIDIYGKLARRLKSRARTVAKPTSRRCPARCSPPAERMIAAIARSSRETSVSGDKKTYCSLATYPFPAPVSPFTTGSSSLRPVVRSFTCRSHTFQLCPTQLQSATIAN